MATYLDNLTTARANLAARLAEVTAERKPSYSIDGESISWESYVEMLARNLEQMDKAIQRAQSPFSRTSRGRV